MANTDSENPSPAQHCNWTLDALNHLDQGISVFDHELRLVAWNQRMLDLLELPAELAIPNQPIAAFFKFNAERGEYGDGNIDELVAERVELAKNFESHVFDRLRPDGTIIEVRGNPMENNGGFVTTYTDVTEQRLSEARLENRVAKRTQEYREENEAHRKTAEALRESERWIRQIADAVPALIAYVDKDNRYQFINNMHREWFQLDQAQLIDTSIFDLVENRNLEQFHQDIDRVLQGEEVQSEYTLRRKAGNPLDVSISFIPHFDEHRVMQGYFFLGQDLTEHKQTQRELIESQKMQALGRLTGGIAHDFNNLLTIILGNLNFLEDYQEDDIDHDEMHEVVQCCQQAARRGSELIQRMLTFSRRQSLKPVDTCVNTLVEDFTTLLQRTLGETVQIQQQLGTNLPAIKVDRNQLETCLLNLTLNARDSMPKGGNLILRTQLYHKQQNKSYAHTHRNPSFNDLPDGHYMMLIVRDEGEGMEPETIARVFEPFFTTKPSGMGTGLGLSMVYGFVKQSGGGIDIQSTLGKGTTVRLIFPIQGEHPLPLDDSANNTQQDIQSASVLLVEDDDGVRQYVHRTLKKMGYSVDLAENGDLALKQLTAKPTYDLVLTDIIMPGSTNGLDLYSHISEDYPQTKVLCMTGYSEQVDATFSEEHLLRKPFQRNQLAEKLQALLKPDHA